MLTKSTKFRLIAFVIVAAVGLTYGAVEYVDLPRILGFGRYNLSLELPQAAGLYANGVVTVRGVPVGQVQDVRLTDQGVMADLEVNDSTSIPRNSAIQVRSTSAIGEQYVNFAPAEAPAPAFSPGEIIPASRIALPIETADLLSRVNGLVASLPREQLSSTIDGLNKAFGNTGPDLQNLLDSARRLQDEATRNLGPTQQLINDLGPVLATQNAGSGDIGSYTGNLAAVTQQLVGSDTDIRGSIDKFPQAATQADKLLNGLRPTVPMLLANLTSVGQVTRVYIPHIAQTLTLLQPVTNQIISTLQSSPTPDAIKINFETVINDPPPCVTGFVQQRRSPADLSPSKPGTNANCKEPANSPILVRGSRNDPCPPASPLPEGRANSASGCGLNFQSPAQAAAVSTAAIRTQLDAEAQVVASAATSPNKGRPNNAPQAAAGQSGAPAPTTDYDSSSGVFMAPGTAQPEVFGNALSQNGRDWRSLLLNPLGVGTP